MPAVARPRQGPTVPRRRPPSGLTAGSLLLSLGVLAGFIALWQAITALWHLEAWLLPSPWDVARALADPSTRLSLWQNSGTTVQEALLGFGAALVVGAGLAGAMFVLPWLRRALYPLLVASQTVPLIAFAAVLIVVFGYGMAPRVFVVAFYAFFAITVNVYDGLLVVDDEQTDMLAALGGSTWQIWRSARIPAALPHLFTGIKLAITYSVAGAVYSEWVGASGGLGYLTIQYVNQFAEAQVFATVVLISALGIGCFALAAVAEWLCLRWTRPL